MNDRLADIVDRSQFEDTRYPSWQDLRWLIMEVRRLRHIEIVNGRMLEGYDECRVEVERLQQQHERDLQTIEAGSRANAELEIENARLRRVLDRIDRATSDATLPDPEARSVVAAWAAEAPVSDGAAAPAEPR